MVRGTAFAKCGESDCGLSLGHDPNLAAQFQTMPNFVTDRQAKNVHETTYPRFAQDRPTNHRRQVSTASPAAHFLR